ncbi:MAG: prepilin peptidase [Oscillospiraceae bacterium]|nr:prepilin peptidase [Oscillospiraceae bacterium]
MPVFDLPPGLIVRCVILCVFLGAAAGSFLHCAAYRIARREPFAKGRSRCPDCGHALGAIDLIPLVNRIILRGRCRYCGARIPPRYFLAELFFGLLTAAALLRFGPTVLCLRNWLFLGCLFLLALVDAEISEIPDGALLAAALIWLAALPLLWNGAVDALLHLAAGVAYGGGILLLSLVTDRLLKKESLGGGDVKLLAVIGLYLGFMPTLFALILACVLGLAQALATKKTGGKQFPFGPALSAAAAVMLFFGPPLAEWYLGLFL